MDKLYGSFDFAIKVSIVIKWERRVYMKEWGYGGYWELKVYIEMGYGGWEN